MPPEKIIWQTRQAVFSRAARIAGKSDKDFARSAIADPASAVESLCAASGMDAEKFPAALVSERMSQWLATME